MKKISLWKILIPSISLVLFVIMLVLSKSVGTKDIGYNNTSVGLATLNQKILPEFPNKGWDTLSDLILAGSLGLFLLAGIVGVVLLVKQKSLRNLVTLIIYAGVMVILAALWIFFDKVMVVTYKPLKNDPSFPSTHILITTYVVAVTLYYFLKLDKNKAERILAIIIAVMLIGLQFLGRIFSAEHWATDAFAGLLLGSFLFGLFIILEAIIVPIFKKEKTE